MFRYSLALLLIFNFLIIAMDDAKPLTKGNGLVSSNDNWAVYKEWWNKGAHIEHRKVAHIEHRKDGFNHLCKQDYLHWPTASFGYIVFQDQNSVKFVNYDKTAEQFVLECLTVLFVSKKIEIVECSDDEKKLTLGHSSLQDHNGVYKGLWNKIAFLKRHQDGSTHLYKQNFCDISLGVIKSEDKNNCVTFLLKKDSRIENVSAEDITHYLKVLYPEKKIEIINNN